MSADFLSSDEHPAEPFEQELISRIGKLLDAYEAHYAHISPFHFDSRLQQQFAKRSWVGKREYLEDLLQYFDETFKKLHTVEKILQENVSEYSRNPPQGETSAVLAEKKRERDALMRRKAELERTHEHYMESERVRELKLQQYDMDLQQLNMQIEDAKGAKMELEEQLNDCVDQLEQMSADNKLLLNEFKKSSADVKAYQQSLLDNQSAASEILRQRDTLIEKNKNLALMVDSLEAERVQQETRIGKMKEMLADHPQTLSAYHVAEAQLAKEEAIEQGVLKKINEALLQAEQAKEETKRIRREKEILKGEVSSAQKHLRDALDKSKGTIKAKLEALAFDYEGRIVELSKTYGMLLDKNSQINAANEAYERKARALEEQNAMLKSKRRGQHFDDFKRGIKSQIELVSEKHSQVSEECAALEREEIVQRAQYEELQRDIKEARDTITRKVRRLESEVEHTNTALREEKGKEALLVSENGRLKSGIKAAECHAVYDRDLQVSGREDQVRQLHSKIEEERLLHTDKLSELKQLLLQTIDYSERWKQAAESIYSGIRFAAEQS